MIEFITGKVVDVLGNKVVLESGGIGYGITVSAATLSCINIGETTNIYTHLSVKDDGLSLFGFYSRQEKDVFLRLITVSGIGPKMAIAVLSGINVDELISIVASGQADRLCSVKGIGKKTAQRITLELKDKFAKDYVGAADTQVQAANSFTEDAISALVSMGFSRQEAGAAVDKVKILPDMGAEEIIIAALKGAR